MIEPVSPLPAITAAVTIDGLAEPPGEFGVVVDRPAAVVELDGSLAGAGADGLTLDVAGATVQGLMIEHFSGDGILFASDGDQFLDRNIVASSIIEDNGSFGVEIDDDQGEDIHDNVISGNTAGGVLIEGANATSNNLLRNLIGTGADGTSPMGNQGPGVLLEAGTAST